MGRQSSVTERVDTKARRSAVLAHAVRAGLVAYGVVHLLLAWVAIRLIVVHDAGSATGSGALSQLADDGIGRWTLGVMSATFGGLVVWQLLASVVGYRKDSGTWRHLMRGAAAARAITYAYLCWASARTAWQGPTGREQSPHSMTARVLEAPAGSFLLVAVGCVTAGIGIGLAVFGWRLGFMSQLDSSARRGDRRTPIRFIGRFGYVAKGAAFVVIGSLLAWAALTQDPKKTGGLDQALYLLLGAELGRIAVVVVGVGIGCFGLYLFVRAWHLELDRITA